MTIPSPDQIEVTKLDAARMQLERAIHLFNEKSDYISALTLAGAAEEILGKALEQNGGLSDHSKLLEVFPKLMVLGTDDPPPEMSSKEINVEINAARNWLKHYGKGEPIVMDPRNEAVWMIQRACGNYHQLVGNVTEAMEPFGPFVIPRGEALNFVKELREALEGMDAKDDS